MVWKLQRVPEPEVMDESSDVEAYASAAAQNYLQKIDRTFVIQVARLFPSGDPRLLRGVALDLGCGPGQIPILMAARWPGLRITGLDAAPAMIEQARKDAARASVAISFQILHLGPHGEARLPFDDASFDLVTSNSVLHHLADPVAFFDEIARVARPDGAVLIRDLRRPSAFAYPLHVRWFGRKYSGEMRRLYEASVQAAYTTEELRDLLTQSRLNDGRSHVFRFRLTHLGIERRAT
ncbi:MAG TPA: class I SAM-dependent methyltransferase [Terriglobales bacterium]|nr:class I SAM-dependent methyltransferase [Terriglobales bacterium]